MKFIHAVDECGGESTRQREQPLQWDISAEGKRQRKLWELRSRERELRQNLDRARNLQRVHDAYTFYEREVHRLAKELEGVETSLQVFEKRFGTPTIEDESKNE